MLNTIWVIERGSHSDYYVVGVFSTQAKAACVLAKLEAATDPIDTPVIREWPLDPAVKEICAGYFQWHVMMRRDGTVERCDPANWTGYKLAGEVMIWKRSKVRAFRGRQVADCLCATVWAKDRSHAIKIANKHRTRMIAEGKWPDADPE